MAMRLCTEEIWHPLLCERLAQEHGGRSLHHATDTDDGSGIMRSAICSYDLRICRA